MEGGQRSGRQENYDKEKLRINTQIRVPRVRVVSATGEQVGILATEEALRLARSQKMDLVEVVATAKPPVCKIIDYGKFRYEQTKRSKESKKSQHQVKVKEVKCRPNIDEHDLQTKLRHAKDFLAKGNRVKFTCMFRGRERAHPERGERVLKRFISELAEDIMVEAPVKMIGRFMSTVVAPSKKKSVVRKNEEQE